MDLSQIPLFSAMKTKLNYGSARQSVLAQNIANADTPDYRAMDIKAPDFKKIMAAASGNQAQKLPMAVTSGQHMSSSNRTGHFKIEQRKLTDELNPTGNNVVIEEEMMKVAENQAQYQQSLNLYRKMVTMFKTALGANSAGA